MSIRFQRANYVVSNLERAFEMYVDVLGMSVEFMKDSPEDSYSYPVFEFDRSVPLRFAVLSTPDQPRVMALTEVPDANMGPAPTPRRAAIVLDVADIDGTVARAREKGFHVYDEGTLLTNDGREGREVGLVDADNNLVVLYYITKAAPVAEEAGA